MHRSFVLFGLLVWAISAEAQTSSYCGNGVLEQGEFCDDGNTLDNDFCSANCLFGAPPQYRATPYLEPTIEPGSAFGLSLVSSVLFGGLTPSLGHMYAGEYRRAFISYSVRVGGWVSLVAGFGRLVFSSGQCASNGVGCGTGLVVLGAGATIGSVLFDVIDAPLAAERSNRLRKKPWQYSISPTATPSFGGLSLQLRF